MTEGLRALRDLQELDRQVGSARAEREAIPREREQRESHLRQAREAVEASRSEALRILARVRELENETATHRERIAKLEIASNMARHAAELLAVQHESKELREKISSLEDEGIALLDRLEECQARERTGRESLVEEERAFGAFREAAEKDLAACEARLAALEAERAQRRASIAPETAELYERLLGARAGEALSTLDGRICQGCFVEVPPNDYVRLVRRREIVQCRHCQRILYLEEDASDPELNAGS